MRTVIIGAHGKVGKRVVQKMREHGEYAPTAFIRKEEQKSYFDDFGVPVIVESLESPEEAIAQEMDGFDAVVFSAGSGAATGYDKTMEVDLYGAIKAIHAALQNNIKRFIMVSAARSDDPANWQPARMRPYYIAKHLADRELTRSGLDYTILRPVRLTDAEDAGTIMIQSDPHRLNPEIPRAAVAEAIVHVLQDASTYGKILPMSEGPLEVGAAIRQFVQKAQ